MPTKMIYTPQKFLISDRQRDDPKLYQALSAIDDALVQLAGGGSGNVGNRISIAVADFTKFLDAINLNIASNLIHWNQLDFTLKKNAGDILGIQNVPIEDLLAGTVNFAGGTTVFQSNGPNSPRLVLSSGVIYLDEGNGLYTVEINSTGLVFGAGRYQGAINSLGVAFTDTLTGAETLLSAGAFSIGVVGGWHFDISSGGITFGGPAFLFNMLADGSISFDGFHKFAGGGIQLGNPPESLSIQATSLEVITPGGTKFWQPITLVTPLAIDSGGTGQITAPLALAALGGVDATYVAAQNFAAKGNPGAHTTILAKITPTGTDGSISWNSSGCVTSCVDPT